VRAKNRLVDRAFLRQSHNITGALPVSLSIPPKLFENHPKNRTGTSDEMCDDRIVKRAIVAG